MQQTAEGIREWFRQCPALAKKSRFGVDFLSEQPTEYAVYMTPSSIRSSTDLFGNVYVDTVQEQNFIFASRNKHSADVLQALANHGFYDSVINWIIEQNGKKNFPKIDGGEVMSILPSLTQYLFEAGANTGRYQISCKMKYRRNI